MSQQISPAVDAATLWKDNIWDRLLDSLDEQAVIPIVGPELVSFHIDGRDVRLDRYLAEELAKVNRLDNVELPNDRALNHVVCQLLRIHKDRYSICDDIYQIMKSVDLQPGTSLKRLAEISAFNLFVATTFDPLLERAINEVRYDGTPSVQSISYSPKRVDDLPCAKDRLPKPTVYHLMGKLSATGSYVLSDEDLLEHVCDLQSPSRRPERLFDELKRNHLLILGEGFSDWLARLFLRTTKGGRLSATRESLEILADGRTMSDPGLVTFLQHFSSHTRVFRSGGACEFVDELHARWRERHGDATPRTESTRAATMPQSVFISYAREDVKAAEELRISLTAAGIPVWFDNEALRAGDSFNPQIEQFITRGCSAFIAVVSKTTEERHEGYFRREWNLAIDRERGMHFERRFILPVIVDETLEPKAVPPRFTELNYTWLPGGRVTPVFIRDIQNLLSSL